MTPGAQSARVSGTVDGSQPALGDLFAPIHTVRSGRHSRDGALWFRTGQHAVQETPVALEDIAPTILAMFGVAPPPHMTGGVLPVAGAQQSASRRGEGTTSEPAC